MEMVSVDKKTFADLNDKRFYFMGGIVSLPFGHKNLEEASKLKAQFKGEITTEIINQMFNFIDLEQNALQKCERIRILRTILNQPPQLFLVNSVNIARGHCIKNTEEYIINGSWE